MSDEGSVRPSRNDDLELAPASASQLTLNSADVSVVIPTYNRAGSVLNAVESALTQRGKVSVEIIVVDDGSTDDTLDRLRPFVGQIITVAFETNRGRNHARNAGLRQATGEWVKFLDSDDILEPGALAQEVATGRKEGAEIVATSFRTARASGERARIHIVPEFRNGIDSLLAGEAVPTAAALYRREALGQIEWNTKLSKLDDWDFFVRAALGCHCIAPCPTVSYTWIEHEGQGSHKSRMEDNAREHHVILRAIESSLLEMKELTQARKMRLAQYFYKELRVLCVHDRVGFEQAVEHIRELDPRFQPYAEEHQWWMKALAHVIGFRKAVLLHTAIKLRLKALA